ncbi:hypothetical protein JOD54_004886 [Actinokineospora baliensis]|uniref:XRE family transcriptional regulator n=1 Tax=Actinokineospora baliensis TaxID=547056 RepID=UPI001957FC53|nr:XRE family transcriptional regulator [Actinokineospora baliensis]MBM7774682.1 hypothetical protein [Actinokineospora baliensis]
MAPSARSEPLSAMPDPDVSTAADFVDALRRLRAWSGLTYRDLEGKAAANGAVLPPSTTASTLGRSTLPRELFVESFVRACGLADDHAARWVEARRRLAGAAAVTEAPDLDPKRPTRTVLALAVIGALALVGALGLLGARVIGSDQRTSPPSSEVPPVPGLAINEVGSWALIHPSRSPALCVTEGHDESGHYRSEVAVQSRCTALPHTFVEPLGDATVQFQWHHPVHGIGCLTVIGEGDGKDLVEPRDDCVGDKASQRFTLDPVAPGIFRLHVTGTETCLSLRDESLTEGTPLVKAPCSHAQAQRFAVELVQPPF